MTPEWPTDPDDAVDPALEPLIEAGEGESEGFEQAEAQLVEHARHGDQHGTEPITKEAAGFDDPEQSDDGIYGEPDVEGNPDA
jgi:hypothetical protein